MTPKKYSVKNITSKRISITITKAHRFYRVDIMGYTQKEVKKLLNMDEFKNVKN